MYTADRLKDLGNQSNGFSDLILVVVFILVKASAHIAFKEQSVLQTTGMFLFFFPAIWVYFGQICNTF